MIGGNIATNAGVLRAVRYGTTRDQVYQIEVVTPTGDIVNLGARLKKKSTGYCLEQLVMGSEGTLGIITKATLKLLPLPPYRFDLVAVFTVMTKAADMVTKVLKAGIAPTSVEFMDNHFLQSSCQFCELTLPHMQDGNYIIITVETFSEDELDMKMEQLDTLCTDNGAVEVLKRTTGYGRYAAATRNPCQVISPVSITDDVVVPVDKVAECIKFVEEHGKKYPFKVGKHKSCRRRQPALLPVQVRPG